MSNPKKIVRVAVNNNFNCTPAEYEQLNKIQKKYPEYYFFVNTNIRTPELENIKNYPYRAVITINPDLIVESKLIQKIYKLDKNKVAFIRVKYTPGYEEQLQLISDLNSKGYEVVVTVQRYNSKKTLYKYSDPSFYKWSHNRYRLKDEKMVLLQEIVKKFGNNTHICDEKGLGCQGCELCASLTAGVKAPLASLNLSSSGLCKFNCPDCYAKTMQDMSQKFGNKPLVYDNIKANIKQSGNTAHIKKCRKELTNA